MQRSRSPRAKGAFAVALLVFAWIAAAAVRAAESAPLLETAHPLDVQLAAGEHRRYRISLRPAETARLSIRQNDAMLHLRIGATGAPLSAPLFTQAGRQATLQWHFEADTVNEWTIDTAAAKADRMASFHLALGAAHATRTQDRLALSAERAFATAESTRIAAGGA
jgi:hypothetical protein